MGYYICQKGYKWNCQVSHLWSSQSENKFNINNNIINNSNIIGIDLLIIILIIDRWRLIWENVFTLISLYLLENGYECGRWYMVRVL